MRRLTKKPTDMRTLICPQCSKPRMTRPMGHVVKLEKRKYKDRHENEVELMIDTCDFCVAKNYRDHFEPTKSDIRKVLKTLQTESKLADNQTLEDLL